MRKGEKGALEEIGKYLWCMKNMAKLSKVVGEIEIGKKSCIPLA